MITLEAYIARHYFGRQSLYAKALGVTPQSITDWIARGYVVFDGKQYAPRKIPQVITAAHRKLWEEKRYVMVGDKLYSPNREAPKRTI